MFSFEAKLNCNIAIYFLFHFQQITVNYSCFLVTYVKEIKMLCKLLHAQFIYIFLQAVNMISL